MMEKREEGRKTCRGHAGGRGGGNGWRVGGGEGGWGGRGEQMMDVEG